MKLIMFDIDGTLTQTSDVDTDCYVQAVTQITSFERFSTDWGSYRHTSDSGILDELYRSRTGRSPTQDEIDAVRSRFVQLLTQVAAKSPNSYSAVVGAHAFIERVGKLEYAIALASGGWRESAYLKLLKAGFELHDVPAAFADDALAREEIMLCSYQRACLVYGVTHFDELSYVGDGTWDAIASKSVGYKFVVIGSGIKAEHLTALGAVAVFKDFTKINSIFSAL